MLAPAGVRPGALTREGQTMVDLLLQSATPVVVVLAVLWLRSDVKRIEGKVDKLADDHNALARELSEVKGYLRGTLPESPQAQ